MARRRSRARNRAASRSNFSRPLSLVMPAFIGAGGALAVNAIVNYAPLPDVMKTGKAIYLTRAGLAVALGMFGSRLPGIGRYAGKMAEGALIVTMADLGKQVATEQGYNLSGYGLGYTSAARIAPPNNVRRMSGVRPGMGMYVRTR